MHGSEREAMRKLYQDLFRKVFLPKGMRHNLHESKDISNS